MPTGPTHASSLGPELGDEGLSLKWFRYIPLFVSLPFSLDLCPLLGHRAPPSTANSFERLTRFCGLPLRLAQGQAPGVGDADGSACLLRRLDSWPR